MSNKALDKAIRRAQSRDKKRRPAMRVSGKNVQNLQRLLGGKSRPH